MPEQKADPGPALIIQAERAAATMRGFGWEETGRRVYGKCIYITLKKCIEEQPAAPGQPKAAVPKAPPPPPPPLPKPAAPQPPGISEPTPPAPLLKAPHEEIDSWLLQRGYKRIWTEKPSDKNPQGRYYVERIPPPQPIAPPIRQEIEFLPPAPTIQPMLQATQIDRITTDIITLGHKLNAVTSYMNTKDMESLYAGEQEYTDRELNILQIFGPAALKEDIQVRLDELRESKL